MKSLSKVPLGTAMGAGVLAFTATGAAAAIVCTGPVCWHTYDSYDYPRDSRVIVHPDDWHWGKREHFVFREHEGRGYWRGGRWQEW
jgi:hypothetical protein